MKLRNLQSAMRLPRVIRFSGLTPNDESAILIYRLSSFVQSPINFLEGARNITRERYHGESKNPFEETPGYRDRELADFSSANKSPGCPSEFLSRAQAIINHNNTVFCYRCFALHSALGTFAPGENESAH